MRLETALRYARDLHEKLHAVGSIIPTPRGDRGGVKVKRVWVFGSTVKGSLTPNDLDLLIHMEPHGPKQRWQDVGFDPEYLRRHGVHLPRSSNTEALKWMRRGKKMVSCHTTDGEATIFDVKVEIFPAFKLHAEEMQIEPTPIGKPRDAELTEGVGNG